MLLRETICETEKKNISINCGNNAEYVKSGDT
jgi:hypothetical protein